MAQTPASIAYVTMARLPTGRAHGYAIMKMCEEFAAQGASVELYVPRRKHHGILGDDPFAYYGIRRSFSIYKLWAVDFLGKYSTSRLAFTLDQLTFLISVLMRNFGDSIVYTRDYQLALLVRSRNIVFEIHTIPSKTLLFLRATARARRIVVISHGLKDALAELGVPEGKITVCMDAVDQSEFKDTPSRELWRAYGVDPDKKIVLYTGAFYGWKGAKTLAEAAKQLSTDTEIVLVGGIDKELSEFKQNYASDHVHIIGYLPRNIVPTCLCRRMYWYSPTVQSQKFLLTTLPH
jgi:glycosyltransferase involved in cell wall biosynthesis